MACFVAIFMRLLSGLGVCQHCNFHGCLSEVIVRSIGMPALQAVWLSSLSYFQSRGMRAFAAFIAVFMRLLWRLVLCEHCNFYGYLYEVIVR